MTVRKTPGLHLGVGGLVRSNHNKLSRFRYIFAVSTFLFLYSEVHFEQEMALSNENQ